MSDAQIRINELARELEVKAKTIIDLLPEYGITEKKTHSSPIPADIAERIRQRITGGAPAEPASTGGSIQPQVYISYAHGDENWRTRIANHLAERGIAVWSALDADSDPDQALRRREKSSVFILLLSIGYVDSEHIRRIEFPHIRSLTASGNAHIIDVVLESCPWQSAFSLPQPTSFTIPDEGRTLASGDEEQIKDDLHKLARAVRDALGQARAGAGVASLEEDLPPEQAADLLEDFVKDSGQSPTPTQPHPLARQSAATLRVTSEKSTYECMATLLSPSIAVTSLQPVSENEILRSANPALSISSPFFDASPIKVTIAATDKERDFAVLRPQVAAGKQDFSRLLRAIDPPTGAKWESFFESSGFEGMIIRGITEGRAAIKGKRYLRLRASNPFPAHLLAGGAPVVSEGQLVGIIAFEENDILYAVSIGDMARSKETAAIRQLLPRASSSSGGAPAPVGAWIDQKTSERFSPATRSTLARSNALRNEANQRRIHIEHLLVALSEQPQSQLADLLTSSRVNLQNIVAPRLSLPDTPHPSDASDELVSLPPVSGNVRRAITVAVSRADADKCAIIVPSHITFGALSTVGNESVRALNSRGVVPERVQLPVGLGSGREPEPESVLAGYQSDDATGPDLLDIIKEVEGLASILAAHDVSPPLSLGLFGDWGTGKSFFMNQLEARIAQLQDDAKLANGDSAYCRNIVQIKFNAWNYIDCNLWASLTAEIFERLAEAIAQTRGNDSPEERALVLAAASSAQTVLEEAERKKGEAEDELKKAEARFLALQKTEAEIESSLNPRDLIEQAIGFASQDTEVRKFADQAARAFHVSEAVSAAHDVRSEILELRDSWSSILYALRNEGRLWLWFAAVGVALFLGWAVNRLALRFNLESLARQVVAALTTLVTFLAPFVYSSKKAMAFIQKARKSKKELVEKKRKEWEDKLNQQRAQLQSKVEATRQAVEEASAKVKALNDQVEKMRADRRLVDYIRHRHQSSDYTQHLGIISRVRADFHHLSTLLREAKEESDANARMKERQKEKDDERRRENKPPLFPPIDRIVLYIDDLDRCPEKNVVEVLQAVHLLLAFPLFVVVVGVDPRWLLHSLQQYSKAFQSELASDAADTSSDDELHWRSTPLNYLEKIFQIPYSLRPIDKKSFERIVDALATRDDKSQPRPAPHPVSNDRETHVAVTGGATAADSAQTPAQRETAISPPPPLSPSPLPPQQSMPSQTVVSPQPSPAVPTRVSPPPVIDRHPEHLRFRDSELSFMKTLHEFIPTPRAAKRFINIYRLVRASLEEEERTAFMGGEKSGTNKIAMLLLAILTGHPAEAAEIFRILAERQPSGTWWEFIASLKTTVLGPTSLRTSSARQTETKFVTHSGSSREQPRDSNHTENQSWLELFGKLDRVKESMGDRSCQHFIHWAPRIARYSFQSGRVISTRRQ